MEVLGLAISQQKKKTRRGRPLSVSASAFQIMLKTFRTKFEKLGRASRNYRTYRVFLGRSSL